MSKHLPHPLAGVFGLFGKSASQSVNEQEWIEKSKHVDAVIQMTDPDIRSQLAMLDLTLDDVRLLHAIQPVIREHLHTVTDTFVRTVSSVPTIQQLVMQHTTIDKLKERLASHVLDMFSGRIDSEYVKRRFRVAEAHLRIGLDTKYFMGAVRNLQGALLNIVRQQIKGKEDGFRIGQAITKVINLEQQVIIEKYEKMLLDQKDRDVETMVRLKQQVAHAVQELVMLTEHTTSSTQEMVASSTGVNESFNQSTSLSRESQRLTQTGSQRVQELESRISQISDRSRQMEEAVKQLKESSVQIRNIVSIVEEISNQTKLLSLNAAIEAARAGEHGAGFGVVANEVKKLSEDTSGAVNQISQLIQKSNQYTQDVVQSITEVQQLVQLGQQEASGTREIFNDIMSSLESSLREVAKVDKEISSLVRVIEQVGASTLKVATTAEQLNQTIDTL